MDNDSVIKIGVHFYTGVVFSIDDSVSRKLLVARIDDYCNDNAISCSNLEIRTLAKVGGRSEFEISCQRQIIDWLREHEHRDRKRVLIIGDSIRMRIRNATGYGLHAYRHLINDFNITHIPHNTSNSNVVLRFLSDWLSCKPDIVHFNAGLHDLKLYPDHKKPASYSSPEAYSANLEKLVQTIRQHGVKHIIWGSNTPVKEAWHNCGRFHRYTKDINEYNGVAERVMHTHD
ncbi:MAG: SGNH/GDSL hydrolase family protein, partial [Nitrososphaeraceae archaeon]